MQRIAVGVLERGMAMCITGDLIKATRLTCTSPVSHHTDSQVKLHYRTLRVTDTLHSAVHTHIDYDVVAVTSANVIPNDNKRGLHHQFDENNETSTAP